MTIVPSKSSFSYALRALAVLVGIFILSWGAIEITRNDGWVSSIWPANAFLLAFLLRVSTKQWLGLCVAAFSAGFVSHTFHADDVARSIILPAIGVIEAFALAAFLRGKTGEEFNLENYKHITLFAVSVIMFPVISAIIADLYFYTFLHAPLGTVGPFWYSADALGLIIFTPLFYVIGWDEIKAFTQKSMRKRSAFLTIALLITLSATFLQTSYPLLFMVFPVLALMAFWLGISGAVIAMGVTTIYSIVCTINGTGPINLMQGSIQEKTIILQGFLAAAVIISLPMAATLSRRQEMQDNLKNAMLSAEKANRAKSDFLTSMSHELRTPLNAISGFAQVIHANRGNNLHPQQLEHLEYIMQGGDHLLNLINDILDLAKIESGNIPVDCKAISANELIEKLEVLLKPLADKRGIRMNSNLRSRYHIMADKSRLTQVLMNLISNAIKYNTENGFINIGIQVIGASARISITDSGNGIAPERQDEIFQPFNRLGAEESEIEGTGIGLAICERLVKTMNGTIGFSSKLGQGSTFWVEFPLAQTEENTLKGPRYLIEDVITRRARILYIEDNQANISLMKALVSNFLNAELEISTNGKTGLDRARRFKPDLIISDIHLPDMTGYDVLAELKNDSATSSIPVIALTADASESRRHEQGPDFEHFLMKPYKIQDFFGIVGKILQPA